MRGSNKIISTHSLTKRLTIIVHDHHICRSISTHSLTKRLTSVNPQNDSPNEHISTHSLTKRLTIAQASFTGN